MGMKVLVLSPAIALFVHYFLTHLHKASFELWHRVANFLDFLWQQTSVKVPGNAQVPMRQQEQAHQPGLHLPNAAFCSNLTLKGPPPHFIFLLKQRNPPNVIITTSAHLPQEQILVHFCNGASEKLKRGKPKKYQKTKYLTSPKPLQWQESGCFVVFATKVM